LQVPHSFVIIVSLSSFHRFKVADNHDIPSTYRRGCFKNDALGEALVIFRLPAVHPFGCDLVEGDAVVLVESSLGGIDPMKDLDRACNPARNPNVVRWHSQEKNMMIWIWHHDAAYQGINGAASDAQKKMGVAAEKAAVEQVDPSLPKVDGATAAAQSEPWPIPVIEGMENWNYHGRVTHEVSGRVRSEIVV
jgi:hypothetical protein